MLEDEIYVALQSAIERSHGAVSWSDIAIAVSAAKERKVREQLASAVDHYSLEALMIALNVAHRELFRAREPSLSSTLTAPPVTPTAAKPKRHGKTKAKTDPL
jgi:hypothetical protein